MRWLLVATMSVALAVLVEPVPLGAAAAHGSTEVARAPTPSYARPHSRPGSPRDHTWLFNKLVRWPACRPLTYRINPDKAPDGWQKLVRKALKKATQASRIRFRYVGRTHQKVRSRSRNPRGTSLVIAFLAPQQTNMLNGEGVAGSGGATSDGHRLFNGKVVLNGPLLHQMQGGFGTGPVEGIQGTQGAVVMHEIGHALGLGHAKHVTQIMYPVTTNKPATWGAGDFKGLRVLGRGGCHRGRVASSSVRFVSRWLS